MVWEKLLESQIIAAYIVITARRTLPHTTRTYCRILSLHRIRRGTGACKTIAITRVYGGADLSAEHCLPVKRSRNETTHRSGRLVSASASSSVRAKELSPSSRPITRLVWDLNILSRRSYACYNIIVHARYPAGFRHASSHLRTLWQISTRFFPNKKL